MLLGGKVEEVPEPFESCEVEFLGGVLPRCPVTIRADSGVSGPYSDALVSEEGRSLAGGSLNSRRKDAPMEEARLGRVSSFSGKTKLGSRTIPEDGTADNLSMAGGDLVDSSEEVPCPGANGTLMPTGASGERTMLLVTLSETVV